MTNTGTPVFRWLEPDSEAFGSPGVEPRWTSSRKDGVSTAYSAASRVWWTVSHGTLNEIYYPTVDRPQTRDMELLFTDEETFFLEEKRDLEHEFEYIDPGALAIRYRSRDPQGRFTVTKEIISDPHHAVVLMHVTIDGDEDLVNRLKCYPLLAPHLDGGGAGNSARSVDVAGHRFLVAWKNNLALAMGVTGGFSRSSCGYVGFSDGYQDLQKNMRMTWQFGQALDGNIAIMGEIPCARHRDFTIAIGFGTGFHAALSRMMQSLAPPFDQLRDRFVDQWHRTNRTGNFAKVAMDNGRLSTISQNVLLSHEDKSNAGAFIASLSIPWGSSKGDADTGGYHLVWTRDMVQTATALMACGRTDTALRALIYLAAVQQADGGFSQNFWIDGSAYWSGIQLDEVAFPILLAWRLWKMEALGNFPVFSFVGRAVAFLVEYAPITQQERWEENAGYSPSTLAVVISALICAAEIARAHDSEELAAFLEHFADWLEAHLDEWTTTDDGVLVPGVKRHYMRIRPPAEGEPFHNPDIPPGSIRIANREPGEKDVFEAREIIDAGFLELVRYGVRRADDPLITDSLKVVDHVLRIDLPEGPCWRRYNHDGYGQRKDGGPYDGSGQGRAWPLLTGERAHFELAAGGDAKALLGTYEKFSSVGGMLPEQVWDWNDLPSEGMFRGKSAGSAQPLAWAHAEYLKLLRSQLDDAVFDRIPPVAERYGRPVQEREFLSTLEIFQHTRYITAVPAGHTLRILDPKPIRVVWSDDNWQTTHTKESRQIGFVGSFVDLATREDERGAIVFTIFWPEENRWLGHNHEVAITDSLPDEAQKQPIGEKPQN